MNLRPTPSIRLTLGADDFGLHPAVDAAIVELAGRGILHATSCMSQAPGWRSAAALIRPLLSRIDVGLHLNLTEGFGAGTPRLEQVILRAYVGRFGRFSRAAVRASFAAQIDAYADAIGALPPMLDGHQHVHQLPAIRDVVLDLIAARYPADARPWVRNTVPAGPGLGFKAGLLATLGGRTMARRLREAGLSSNRGFLGVYGFDAPDEAAYGAEVARWLSRATDGALMMCHPATIPPPGDPIGRQRPIEYRYLASEAFARLRAQAGITLGRLVRPAAV